MDKILKNINKSDNLKKKKFIDAYIPKHGFLSFEMFNN